ncbi:heme/hemin ABC transporter substrate-binding protein [Alteromonas flava]|uniref:heme/hemin ABC transporter substrate-binding protein n=1 Tax=Alteromonas flava TaxID=2048003 RepID=UPI0013DA9274|nr:ABC transporter substrate-binding protein [Alteromonas flava]
MSRLLLSVALALIFMSTAVFDMSAQEDARVVTAGGSVTEILHALGAGKSLVAVDTSSTYPAAVNQLPKVGYYRQLPIEGIVALRPDLVIGVDGVGPTRVLQQLRSLGIQVEQIQVEKSVAGLLSMIRQTAELVDKQSAGEALVYQVQSEFAEIATLSEQGGRAAFLMNINERGMLVAGQNTVPDLIYTLAGTQNVFADVTGFKPLSSEAFLQRMPDWLMIPEHQRQGMQAEQFCAMPALKRWAQHSGCRIVFVDPLLFLGLTPRLPDAVRQVMAM